MKEEVKYKKAVEKVKQIKGCYIHLTIYIIINTLYFLLCFDIIPPGLQIGHPKWPIFISPITWGTAVFFHWLYVFKGKGLPAMLKHWEERKINEYIEKEHSRQHEITKSNKL